MSGSFYTPYSAYGQAPGAAFATGFAGAQNIERNAQQLEEADQMMKLRQLQNERNQAAEARASQLFPVQLGAAEFSLKQAGRRGPIEIQKLELDLQNLRSQIGERAAAATATRNIAFPSYSGAAPAAAPAAPGVAPPNATRGVLAPEAVVGPQSSLPAWLSPDFGERRFTGTQLASAGTSDSTGLPTGLSPVPPESTAPAPAPTPGVRPGPTQQLPVFRPDLPTTVPSSDTRLVDAAVAELSLSPALQTPSMIAQVANQYNIDPNAVAQRLGVTLPASVLPPQPAPAPAGGMMQPARLDLGVSRAEYPDLTPAQTEEAREQQQPIQGRQAEPSTPYLVEPARIGQDRERLTRAYNRLQSEFRAAVASRDREAASRLSREAEGIVDELRYLDGMTALTRLRVNDPAPIANAMFDASGGRLQLQPRSDGRFNVYLDGQVVNQGITREQVENSGRALFDTTRRAQIQTAQRQNAELALYAAKQRIEQLTRATADTIVKEAEAAIKRANPELDVRTLTDQNNQQYLVVTDKRTGAQISSARIIRLPAISGREERVTLETVPISR